MRQVIKEKWGRSFVATEWASEKPAYHTTFDSMRVVCKNKHWWREGSRCMLTVAAGGVYGLRLFLFPLPLRKHAASQTPISATPPCYAENLAGRFDRPLTGAKKLIGRAINSVVIINIITHTADRLTNSCQIPLVITWEKKSRDRAKKTEELRVVVHTMKEST